MYVKTVSSAEREKMKTETNLNNFNKDFKVLADEEEIRERLRQLKKEKHPALYKFEDLKREFIPNGCLYVGATKDIIARIKNFYKRKATSELVQKLAIRLGCWDSDSNTLESTKKGKRVEDFIYDPKRCRLIIIEDPKFKNPDTLKTEEKILIFKHKPLLNKEPWYGGFRATHRRFYMNQLDPDPAQRCGLPVYCVHTGDIRQDPTEEYREEFWNKNKFWIDAEMREVKEQEDQLIEEDEEERLIEEEEERLIEEDEEDEIEKEEERLIEQQIEDDEIRKAEEQEEERLIEQQIEDDEIRKAEEQEEERLIEEDIEREEEKSNEAK